MHNSGFPRPAKHELILGVGWHAFVNWSPPTAKLPVPLVDALGRPLGNDLADGQEVEILSWRPRSRHGLSYQIRRLSDDSEWWIGAAYLRRGATPTQAPPAVTRAGKAPGR